MLDSQSDGREVRNESGARRDRAVQGYWKTEGSTAARREAGFFPATRTHKRRKGASQFQSIIHCDAPVALPGPLLLLFGISRRRWWIAAADSCFWFLALAAPPAPKLNPTLSPELFLTIKIGVLMLPPETRCMPRDELDYLVVCCVGSAMMLMMMMAVLFAAYIEMHYLPRPSDNQY